MGDVFQNYVNEVDKIYRSELATEHSYRGTLQTLLANILTTAQVTNEPKRQRCGAPDYIISRNNIDIGYIEAKDIGKSLDAVERGGKDDTQWQRYTQSLENIILTDYLELRFFRNGVKNATVQLAEICDGRLVALPQNFDQARNLLLDFAAFQGQTIKSAKKLAEMMARKAALMRDVFYKVVTDDTLSSLKDQHAAFKQVLMHDMDEAQFADVYAQTIAYGLFTARLHDTTLDSFSRSEALTLIPKSNPFLRQLFHYVAGPDLDDRVVWIVDALCEVYHATNLRDILADFGSATGQNDPLLHFYETFLAAYDPALRKSRGVWYTPQPVVRFIVRAIDDVLKSHFGLKDGLAHTGMVDIEVDTQKFKGGKQQTEKRSVHKVQLLDVATGTGTFLAEAVKQIYKRYEGQQGVWSGYVEQHLLPRLHGFELLMASYAMCHMKLDLLLQETGYKPSNPNNPPRVSVYLTNSLEEHHPDTDTLFASWLSREANEASHIKKDMPIMVAFGNPPYSGHSSNKGEWISKLINDYKFEFDGKPLKERMYKWLQDDYVKFIRLGEHYVEKNGEGVLAYITNHAFLDNPTFRGMRWHLLNTFDDILIINLNGSAKRNQINGDQNVFDIQQGVAILICVKKSINKKLSSVKYYDIFGNRKEKYEFLDNSSLDSINFFECDAATPSCLFIPINNNTDKEKYYDDFLGVAEIFSPYGTPAPGIVTTHDEFAISNSSQEMIKKVESLLESENEQEARKLFKLCSQNQWNYMRAVEELKLMDWKDLIVGVDYRPFDVRVSIYDKNVAVHKRERASKHFLPGNNIGMMLCRQQKASGFQHVLMHRNIPESSFVSNKTSEIGYTFPLYIYTSIMGSVEEKCHNFDPKIYELIQKIVATITPEDLFDYIYAVLHSRAYRTRYAEFLKSDFPRIPYPKNAATFHALAAQGAILRGLHLMESDVLDTSITTFNISGTNEVVKPRWEADADKPGFGKVWLNDTQYFGNVPQVAWEFYIGGYQPAQKWLKDRKGRILSTDDLMHWQRIIVALTETEKVMSNIERIDFLPI